MSTLQRVAGLSAIAVVLSGALIGCSKSGTSASSSSPSVNGTDAVVTVNGTPITQADFYTNLESYQPQSNPMGGVSTEPAGDVVMRRMISNVLLEQLAQKDKVYPSDADIQQRFDMQALQSDENDIKPFADQLKEMGITPEYVEKMQIIPDLCQMAEATKGITVVDADIKAFYDLHVADHFTRPESAHVKRIVLSSEADAKDVYNQLLKGTPFDQLYTRSVDKTLPNGDIPQWVGTDKPKDPSAAPLIDAIKKTDIGKPTPPVKLGQGWWVLLVVEKRPKEVFPLDKVKGIARTELLNQRLQQDPVRFSELQAAIRDKQTTSQIVANDPKYKTLVQQILNPPAPQAPPSQTPQGGAPQSAPPPTARPQSAPGAPVKVNPANGVVIKPKQ